MGFGPHVVDLNGDGHRDVISGSYPGELYIFAGNGKGGFGKGEQILDAKGEVLKVGSATVVFATDWEGDGDLDLVVGDIEGRVSLVPNESGDATLKFGAPSRLATAAGEISAPGRNSGPTVADWDGDGRPDLLVGCGDGSVLFFRDTAESGAPVLAEPVVLLGASGSEGNPCGMRSKLAVTDWNADGKLDLLLGDFSSETPAPKQLSKEEQAKVDALLAEQQETGAAMGRIYAERRDAVDRKVREEMGLPLDTPMSELLAGLTVEQRGTYSQKHFAAMQADPEYAKLMARSREIAGEMGAYRPSPAYHGYVWLFLRN